MDTTKNVLFEAVSEEPPESPTAGRFWSKYAKYGVNKKLVFDDSPYHTVGTRNVPPAYAEVDVKLDDNGEKIDSFMLAGMVGMHVSSSGDVGLSSSGKNDTVRPVAGWWICVKKQNVISAQEEEAAEMARMMKELEEKYGPLSNFHLGATSSHQRLMKSSKPPQVPTIKLASCDPLAWDQQWRKVLAFVHGESAVFGPSLEVWCMKGQIATLIPGPKKRDEMVHCTRQVRKTLCSIQAEMTRDALPYLFPANLLQKKWMSATPERRGQIILAALVHGCSAMALLHQARWYTEKELDVESHRRDGQLFLDLLEEMMVNNPTSAPPTTPTYISNPVWDRMAADQQSTKVRASIRSTPAFYAALSRGWAAAVAWREATNQWPVALFLSVASFLSEEDIVSPANLEALVEGADNNMGPIPLTALRQIDIVVTLLNEPSLAHRTMAVFNALLVFLGHILDSLDSRHSSVQDIAHQLLTRLLRQELITNLLRVVRTLADVVQDLTAGKVVDMTFRILQRLFGVPSYNPLAQHQFSTGLPDAIVACAPRTNWAEVQDYLLYFLEKLLPSLTVYRDQLPLLKVALTQSPREPRQFSVLDVRDAWLRLVALVQRRVALSESHPGKLKACDNTLCGVIGTKAQLKRCTGCYAFYYCSIRCQSVDWHNEHKASCWGPHSILLNDRLFLVLPRQRSFLRAIVHEDYMNSKLQIYTDIVKCMRAHPNTGYFVHFNYVRGAAEISVHPLDLEAGDSEPGSGTNIKGYLGLDDSVTGSQGQDLLARAARSEGRMVLHVICFCVGGGYEQHWIVPLRSSSGMVCEEMARFAQGGEGEGEEGLVELVERSNAEVVEMH
ncbi:hypothetical protein FB45DRAFT_1058199 [Roridomyces roridus]|uniref:MYND-type domain-containing protein n=1 Tax=Roridomyces roridus TaxID=1738132 RepID=A0AAD7BXR2_9AGAR|nr:hypothetical protein FB45DRAFT_1058199 [Roridomyces roridus]